MKASKLVVTGMLAFSIIIVYFGLRNTGSIENNYTFPGKLSDLKLFKGPLKERIPDDNVQLLELSSTLYTDHADKQRLLKLPPGTKLKIIDDGLPQFPEGSLLAKTFYYPNQPIETRILYLKNGKWNAATYQWNVTQTEALLLTNGATVLVKQKNKPDINYAIPTATECSSCHRSNGRLQPIGPKIRNLNRMIIRNNESVSQLTDLQQQQLLDAASSKEITAFPDYNDPEQPLALRARAYMELNCAHCHQAGGMAGYTNLLLSYEIPFGKTGLARQQPNIIFRMETSGTLHMPKLGTTTTDPVGLALIKAYIKSLDRS